MIVSKTNGTLSADVTVENQEVEVEWKNLKIITTTARENLEMV